MPQWTMQRALSDRRTQEFELLAKLRLERKSIAQISSELKKDRSTIQRWLADPVYRQFFVDLQASWKESTQAKALEMGLESLAIMRELMLFAKSEHVRFEAAKAIGDWAGLGKAAIEPVVDDRDELKRLNDLIAARTVTTAVVLAPVPTPDTSLEGEFTTEGEFTPLEDSVA